MHASRSANDLELQQPQDPRLVAAVQALRYRFFSEELGAVTDHATRAAGRDADAFDAVVDRQFNTVDVCLVLPIARLEDRYLRHLATRPAGHAVAA